MTSWDGPRQIIFPCVGKSLKHRKKYSYFRRFMISPSLKLDNFISLWSYLVIMHLWFPDMESMPALDIDSNHSHPSPNSVQTLSNLNSEAQGSWFVTSERNHPMGAPFHACWSLYEAINCSSFHSPLP